ncbi:MULTISPECIES: YdcF family protein [unclassified Nostoc]|uniref:YdcF family protein n=1 Tax=unclassified Nostoc TaxID=2593658 RepID=UPI002AD3DC8A|nr:MULTISPECIES: YdcF family protein [unclassified Nostoc]MDZ8125727.1 YdcF family protein [Nostoc sp. CmiVER01]MDZ8224351.1 YdcF family protein [Nostoc sp. ChiVER01]
MKRKSTIKSLISIKKIFTNLWQSLQKLTIGLYFVLGVWLIFTTITLVFASSQPVDAFFVLGGSIHREIYVAQQAKQYPQTPILISHGSPDPCIWLIFQAKLAGLQNVWLENCANSTFENFYYGIPILRRWGVHKVMLITSPSHLPRAKWMAQILLGAHGIWVETEIVEELGVPGNNESWAKTGLDVTRSLFWAIFSQIIQPQCSNVTRLTEVDMQAWKNRGFHCEHQVGVGR